MAALLSDTATGGIQQDLPRERLPPRERGNMGNHVPLACEALDNQTRTLCGGPAMGGAMYDKGVRQGRPTNNEGRAGAPDPALAAHVQTVLCWITNGVGQWRMGEIPQTR